MTGVRRTQKQVDELVARLQQRFPEAPSSGLRTEVEAAYELYAGSRVPDFVPILVERAVVDLRRPARVG